METMAAFTGVATTGIYCRPECPARPPKPGNTRQFLVAAAAEAAGYRACLRCRPYRGAVPVPMDSPELVCRAVRLILAGGLDGQAEQDLGRRLGVSARHLRRLFTEHLGCTPSQLARSARAHFARRLLDDTDLAVIEVAFACGYGSVRQLSRDFQAIFRATPTQLRTRRRRSDRLIADGGLLLRLPYQPPLAWPAMLDYLRAHAIPGVECVTNGTYRRTIDIDGDPGVLEFSPGGPDYLLLRAHLPHWAGLIHITARARALIGLDTDYQAAHRHLSSDPLIGPLMRQQPGLRPPGTWVLIEPAVQAILTSMAGETRARNVAAQLVLQHGKPVPGLTQLGLTHLFPSPAALAAADLRQAGCTPDQATAVTAFARAAATRSVCLDGNTALDDLITRLLEIPALTPPIAHYLALRLGYADACPASAPAPASQPWRPFRAFAATYLSAAATGQLPSPRPGHRSPAPGPAGSPM
jgi:AraC family transcriptional regulator, regulatory protein of adaptative response / DNA-3-methyladenine glycosylase II